MEQDHFLKYLDQVTSPERKLVFQDAIQALKQAGILDHVFWIDQMMEQDDLGDATDFLRDVEDMLRGAIASLMLRFGVRLDDQCPLVLSTDILKAIAAMDNWDDKAALSNLAELNEPPEAILSEMLQVTGSHHSAVYLPHLFYVSQNLIDRIDRLNAANWDAALPSREEHERAQTRLSAFYAGYSAPILSQAISEMLLIGGDYKGLLSSYEADVQKLAMEPAVNELVGFALASDLPNGDALKKAILDECQGWWDGDTNNATKLSSLVTERLKKANAL
jgi:hypothetical protein